MTSGLTVVDHPLVQHKLTILRNKDTPTAQFRQLLREIAAFLCCEATRDLPLETVEVETPLEKAALPYLEGKKLCFVSVLRAGNGLIEGALDVAPSARVGHIGMMRDHETLEAVRYYYKTPGNLEKRRVILTDPMLATGNTAIAAASLLKENGASNIKFMCLVAAPEGINAFQSAHPDIPIITAAIDRELNEKGYILPGLGDAGDRIYGTKE